MKVRFFPTKQNCPKYLSLESLLKTGIFEDYSYPKYSHSSRSVKPVESFLLQHISAAQGGQLDGEVLQQQLVDMARYMTDWGKNVFDVFDVFRI